VLLFAVYLGWLPAPSMNADGASWAGMLRAYAMPVITLTFVVSGLMIRMIWVAKLYNSAGPPQ